MWFEGYDSSALSLTPRVYLVPAGLDVMTVPTSGELMTREWNVVDQRIPVPYTVGESDLADPDWIPVMDSLSAPLAELRRLSSFRAYPDKGPEVSVSEMTYDSRLGGRSVWNTRWLVIIPGITFLHDPAEGVDTFINGNDGLGGITDIRFVFNTFSFSGN
jgi:hypothetical protein